MTRAFLFSCVLSLAAATAPPVVASSLPPIRQPAVWMMFVDGAQRDIDGEWSGRGRVAVLRPAMSITDIARREVMYPGVWQGIDARVNVVPNGTKYSFDVEPRANPRAIHIRYSGADRVELNDSGELSVFAGRTKIVHGRPTAYQRIGGKIVPVAVRFVQFDADVAFAVGGYDRSHTLFIDSTTVE